jgi:hypothetical protein
MTAVLRPKSAKFLDPEAERSMKTNILKKITGARPISRYSRPVASISGLSVTQDAVKAVIKESVQGPDMMRFLEEDSLDENQIDIKCLETLKERLLQSEKLEGISRF